MSRRFVTLFAIWWLLDMAFVWISPRSYEQYYLPLNASAAMCGGYALACLLVKIKSFNLGLRCAAVGLLLLVFFGLSFYIYTGIYTSPHSNTIYKNPQTGEPEKRRGYAQKLREVHYRKKYDYRRQWEALAKYIREQSNSQDKIYVWGWYPGIYVYAQRLSPAPKAFEGNMHILSPEALSARIAELLEAFEKSPPKFIVDSRKPHFPWNRPNLELWPSQPTKQGKRQYLPASTPSAMRDRVDQEQVKGLQRYMAAAEQAGRGKADPAELERYKVMRPFRDYVMDHYQVVGDFGAHALFQRK